MSLSNETTVVVSQSLSIADLGDEAIVLDPTTGTYFGLNEVATRILALSSDPITVGEIVDRLLEEFDVDREHLKRDVSAFVQDLARRGMIDLG